MLTVSNLRKQFSTVLAVDDVSFSVKPGQIFGLIGPNGAGKTTTIRMIMDIIQPDSGTVTIDGVPMQENTKHLVGYLPEERGLYRRNKLLDVIAYFGSLKGLTTRQAREAAMPLLERFSLMSYAKRNVEELSKGNQQKVQFIISILHRPKLLVLDELFSGLDPVNQVLMKEELLRLKQEQHAIIFSTHQMEQAEKLCDELVMINHGRSVLHGSPSSIKSGYGKNALRVEFLGDGAILRDLPGVISADITQHYAELELAPEVRTNDLIASMLPLLEVASVSRMEPSLQSIFIDIAGLPHEDVPEVMQLDPDALARMARLRDKVVKKHFIAGLISLAAMLVFVVLAIVKQDFMFGGLALILAARGAWAFTAYHRRKKLLRAENAISQEARP